MRLQRIKCKGQAGQATGKRSVSRNVDDGGCIALRQRSLSVQLAEVYTHGAFLFHDLPKRGRCSFGYNVEQVCHSVAVVLYYWDNFATRTRTTVGAACDEAYNTYLFVIKYKDN